LVILIRLSWIIQKYIFHWIQVRIFLRLYLGCKIWSYIRSSRQKIRFFPLYLRPIIWSVRSPPFGNGRRQNYTLIEKCVFPEFQGYNRFPNLAQSTLGLSSMSNISCKIYSTIFCNSWINRRVFYCLSAADREYFWTHR